MSMVFSGLPNVVHHRGVSLDEVFAVHGGLATTEQLLATMTYRTLVRRIRAGEVVRVWHGVYAQKPPGTVERLAALELVTGRPIVACMNTAAELFGFHTEKNTRVHVLDPGLRVRPSAELMVHQRSGAPLRRIQGRLATAPAWTAVELARGSRRSRALAVLDAVLFKRRCTTADLARAIDEQKGRRGIVKVRELMRYVDGRAESPMESEARLVFIDGGLPHPSRSTKSWTAAVSCGEWTSRGQRRCLSQSTRAWNGMLLLRPSSMTG
jgi:hypothetical protein